MYRLYWGKAILAERGKKFTVKKERGKRGQAGENHGGHMRKQEATPAPEADSIVTLIHRLCMHCKQDRQAGLLLVFYLSLI